MIAFVDGKNVSSAVASGFPSLAYLPSAPADVPPADEKLLTMHSWSADVAQSLIWSPAGTMIDAVKDCGATPNWVNATDDDGAAIERCLREH